MNENDAVKQKRGKWSEPGVPHKGWSCINLEVLEKPELTCEMCESQLIRNVHHMSHPEYSKELRVGCICASHMEQDIISAKKRDDFMKSRTSKRNRWLTRDWKISKKGNDYIKTDGYLVTVYPREDNWVGYIEEINGDYKKRSRNHYGSSDEMKLACFDVLTKRLSTKFLK